MIDIDKIEQRIDRAITASMPLVVGNARGLIPQTMGEAMECAKLMSLSGAAVPKYLRGNPGTCLAISLRAYRWQIDPFYVAEKSYLMFNPKTQEDKIGYESQLIHTVIETCAPIKGRLRHEILGEGDERCCKVWATFKTETEPHIFTGETLAKRIKDIGVSERGNFKGSPLWHAKPGVQLFYDASRDWARLFCPDVLAGAYARDELADMEPVDVTPKAALDQLAQRLKDAKAGHATSFDAGEIARAATSIIEGDKPEERDEAIQDPERREYESDVEGRADQPSDRTDDDHEQSGSNDVSGGDREIRGGSTGEQQAPESKQGEIFPPDPKQTAKPKKDKRR